MTTPETADGQAVRSTPLLERFLADIKTATEGAKSELLQLFPIGAAVMYRTWNMRNKLPAVVHDVTVYNGRPLVFVKPNHKRRGRWMQAAHVHRSNNGVTGMTTAGRNIP